MSCPDHEALSAFADRELDASERAAIEPHLSGCAACREFVDEMVRLDAHGRSSFRSISITDRRSPVAALEAGRWPRWMALAAAAVIFATISASIWFFGHRPQRVSVAEVQESRTDGKFEGTSDAAFERWARPYRGLRIPLVPLEDVANHKPPEVTPIAPETNNRNDKI
jgi:anti-sigma factor RsiW